MFGADFSGQLGRAPNLKNFILGAENKAANKVTEVKGKMQVQDAPSIGTDGELPVGDEEAIFKHYGFPYQPGAGDERQLARR